MPEQRFLDTKVWCPVSGFKQKGGTPIPPHKIPLMACVDGKTLYARCQLHLAKVFIQHKETVDMILASSTVIRVREKRAVEKEIKNAAS